MADKAPTTPPPAPPKKRVSLGSAKNLIMLGVVGVGGYYAYQKFVKPELKELKADAKSVGKKSVQGPDLNGPMVTKFMVASTKTNICIDTPVPGFVYAPITSTNSFTGYRTFTATAAGHFTRRELCRGAKRFAEIAPLRTGV